jgi:prophage regulatory protein
MVFPKKKQLVSKRVTHNVGHFPHFQGATMPEHESIRIERKPAVLSRTGMSHATLYRRISEDLFPPGVTLGSRSVGWLAHEVDAMLNAFASGKTTDELQAIVKNLIEKRQTQATQLS